MLLIQGNCSKQLYQRNTGNGAAYIQVMEQGIKEQLMVMLQNVNNINKRAYPHCSGV